MKRSDFIEVLVNRRCRFIHRAAQHVELQGPLKELLVGHHSILDYNGNILELLLKITAVVFEHLLQFVGYLLGNVSADFFDIAVGLQVASRYIERNIPRVDYPVQHH